MFLNALRKYDKEHMIFKDEVKDHVNIPKKDEGKYTDMQIAKDKRNELLTYLRDAIKGELEAILLYEYFIINITDNNLIELISKITSDEKEHVEELTLALTILDKDCYY